MPRYITTSVYLLQILFLFKKISRVLKQIQHQSAPGTKEKLSSLNDNYTNKMGLVPRIRIANESLSAQGSCQYFTEICNQERNQSNQESSKCFDETCCLVRKKDGRTRPDWVQRGSHWEFKDGSESRQWWANIRKQFNKEQANLSSERCRLVRPPGSRNHQRI